MGIGNPVRGGDDDFLVVVDQGLEGEEQRAFRSAVGDDLVGSVGQAVIFFQPADDGLLEGRRALVFRVLGVVILNRLDSRGLDGFGGRKIGLADAQVNDVEAFGFHRLGFGADLERRRGADAVGFVGNHDFPFPKRPRGLFFALLFGGQLVLEEFL